VPAETSCAVFVRFAVTVNAVQLQIAGAHLNWYDGSYRSAQLADFKQWLSQYGPNRIVVGDFNAEPNDPSLWTNWTTDYFDVWARVVGSTGDSGITKDRRTVTNLPGRIDYQFVRLNNPHIGVQQFSVVKTALSDHHLLLADYTIQ
jgi:endonuclease/exonuclease/phosphatase family metal-dependent hydrolase